MDVFNRYSLLQLKKKNRLINNRIYSHIHIFTYKHIHLKVTIEKM